MNAVALQIPGYESREFIIAKDQPEYIPLPAMSIVANGGLGVMTRWRPSDEERAALANGADIWLIVLNGGEPLQPVMMLTECPILPTVQS